MRKPDLSCDYPEHITKITEGMRRTPEHTRRAWKLDVNAPDTGAVRILAQWLINCPYLHPAVSFWVVSAVELVGRRFQSEFAVTVLQVEPNELPDPDGDIDVGNTAIIQSLFDGVSKEEAVEITESCVLACIGSHLSPDSSLHGRWNKFIDDYKHALLSECARQKNAV